MGKVLGLENAASGEFRTLNKKKLQDIY